MGRFDDLNILARHFVAVARDDHALYRDIPVSLDGRRHRARGLARSDNHGSAFWRRRKMFRNTAVRQSRRRGRIEHITEQFAMVGNHSAVFLTASQAHAPAYAGFEPISKFASSSSARTMAE